MATSLDLPPYADATAASSAPAQMMRAAQAAQADRDRKAKEQAAESARQDAQLKLNQQAGVRADQSAQEEARKARVAQLPATMATDAIQWDAPDVKGKPFNEIPDYARKHFIDAYGETGAVPEAWNEAQRSATGNASVGRPTMPSPQPGQTIHQDAKGGISTQQTYQAPSDGALSDNQRTIAEAIANYDMPPSQGLGRFSQADREKIMAYAANLGYDAKEYPARLASRKDFTSGKAAFQITSLNALFHHLDAVMEAQKKVGNTRAPFVNAPMNYIRQGMGNADIGAFDTNAGAVAEEMAKLLKGGVATKGEIDAWNEKLNSNLGPAQVNRNLREMMTLIAGRVDALRNQWQAAYNKPRDLPFIDESSKRVLEKHGFNPGEIDPAAKSVPPASAAAAARIANRTAPPAEAPAPSQPLPPAANSQPKVVIQNGVTYTLQPDGNYR